MGTDQGTWSRGQKCQQPGCTSKATFWILSKFNEHMLNIHLRPLLCDFPGCTHRKPFGRHGDLDRHKKTKHRGLEERPFKCPDPTCPSHSNGFARKDKLSDHTRNQHGALPCYRPHCGEFLSSNHQHGDYICWLGSCRPIAGDYAGEFSRQGLEKHLHEAHGCIVGDVKQVMKSMESERWRFIDSNRMGDAAWIDCAECKAKLGKAALTETDL